VSTPEALSPRLKNGAEMGGSPPPDVIDGIHCNGSQSHLHLQGEFLRSVAPFVVDSTFSHPPQLFNWIEVRAIGGPMKRCARDSDISCTECFLFVR
jgi:hypothetical protein